MQAAKAAEAIAETKSFVVMELQTERSEDDFVRPETSLEMAVVDHAESQSKLEDLKDISAAKIEVGDVD